MKYSIKLQENIKVNDSLKMADGNDEYPSWKRKYEELERCLTRIQKLYDGVIIHSAGEDSFQSPKDFVRNFFRVSYELKEMLKKDPNAPINANDVEQFCTNNVWAGLGIDIANQMKHGSWQIFFNRRKTNKTIGLINSHVHILPPDGQNRTELTIEIDGNKEDCLKLARNTFSAWREFLKSSNLS